MKKIIICVAAMQFVLFGAFAKPRTSAQIQQLAQKAINSEYVRQHKAPRTEEIKMLQKTDIISVMGYNEGGFAIISNDDLMPDVLAVGSSRYTGAQNENLRWWLNCIEKIGKEVAQSGVAPHRVPGPDTSRFPEEVDALVTAEWGQESPYWNLCPGSSSNRCLTGCVATALAQVLYTNRYPSTGVGERTIYYNSTPVYANFGETIYDYDNMIDSYAYGYTDEQAEAVATLMLHCGVAVNMDYAPDGSGAYSDQAADGMKTYFGIETTDFKERENYSDADWMDMIYEELAGGHAMYYSGVDGTPWIGGGHAFVCDGYDSTGKVHINWGWNGSDNGYYNIDLLNPSGYSFSMYQDFIMGLFNPDDAGPVSELITLDIETTDGGQLLELIGQENLNVLKGVNITGKINDDDVALLKKLASGVDLTEYGFEESKSRLANIDLTNAILENDEIADEAFKEAKILRTIKLPRQLARIGNYAFADCSKLSSIRSYTYSVPKMGTRVFENVNNSNMKVQVIAGSSDYYRRNAQWKTIITTENVTEFGTCLKAKNTSREQGQQNPVLGYQLFGDRVVGTPNIWTEATPESEPGKYDIFIEAGTITETENVIYVNGVLTVKESSVDGIDNITVDADAEEVYNINGTKATDATGIVIKNGKKYIGK